MAVYLYGANHETYGDPGGTYGAPDAVEWRHIEGSQTASREVEGSGP
jgi:hypothetical protein